MAKKPRQSQLLSTENESVSIRRISNGFLIARTVESKDADGNTQFSTTETFSAEKPDLGI